MSSPLESRAAGEEARALPQPPCDHLVQFYEDDTQLAANVSEFLSAGFAAGDPLLVIATKPHCDAFVSALRAEGFNVEGARRTGQLQLLDARETLDGFMDGNSPHAGRFDTVVGSVVDATVRSAGSGRKLRAYGEMVNLLWQDGNSTGALRLEELWNDLSVKYPFELLCAYSMANFYRASQSAGFKEVCARHGRVLPLPGASARAASADTSLQVALLQQKARALEAEVLQRQDLEAALRQALAERRHAERELADFVENAVEGLHRVGPDGRILWANQAELDLLGYTREEYVGRHISEFHVDRAKIDDMLARLARGETLRDFPTQLRRKDGSVCDVLIHSNVLWEDGKFVHTRCYTRDITARKAGDDAAARLAAIIESSDDAIVSKDLNGVVRTWNKGAERIFGYTAAEMVGQSIRRIIPADRQGEEDEVLSKVSRGEMVDHFQTIRLRKDGTPIHISLTVSPIRSPSGELIGASKIARDITEHKGFESERERLLASEREARQVAERANRVKDEFMAMLSHELRSPLNAISGWTQVAKAHLRDGKPPLDVMQRALDVIERNVGLQARLIDDLLDISRIVSGKLQLESRPVNLTAIATNAIESVRPSADSKGITLSLDASTPDPWVLADPARLEQVLWNLLVNAVKFTPDGGRIDMTIAPAEKGIAVSVRDTGQGIDTESLPHVFDRFWQARDTMKRMQGGLGLGLALVRYLAELHGGSVEARSDGRGCGSTFTVTLPFFMEASNTNAQGENALRGVRALVVDDFADAREMLGHLLEYRGAEVHTAASVREALALLEKRAFDVVLTDLGMPEQDGYAMVRGIRAHPAPRVRSLPVIAVTAYSGDGERDRALSQGFDDYVVKPVLADQMAASIARQLMPSRAQGSEAAS